MHKAAKKHSVLIFELAFIVLFAVGQIYSYFEYDSFAGAQSGIYKALFYIQYWPSVLFTLIPGPDYPSRIAALGQILHTQKFILISSMNVIMWGMVGAFIGAVTSGILKWRRTPNE